LASRHAADASSAEASVPLSVHLISQPPSTMKRTSVPLVRARRLLNPRHEVVPNVSAGQRRCSDRPPYRDPVATDPRGAHIDRLDQQVTEHPVGVRDAGLGDALHGIADDGGRGLPAEAVAPASRRPAGLRRVMTGELERPLRNRLGKA
jgi:hypothetical protein